MASKMGLRWCACHAMPSSIQRRRTKQNAIEWITNKSPEKESEGANETRWTQSWRRGKNNVRKRAAYGNSNGGRTHTHINQLKCISMHKIWTLAWVTNLHRPLPLFLFLFHSPSLLFSLTHTYTLFALWPLCFYIWIFSTSSHAYKYMTTMKSEQAMKMLKKQTQIHFDGIQENRTKLRNKVWNVNVHINTNWIVAFLVFSFHGRGIHKIFTQK